MKTICFINQKGGCGKSSSCFHIAGHLVKSGRRVLVVDADPQGSLSQAIFGSEYVEMLESRDSLAALFDDDTCSAPFQLPKDTQWQRLSIICANHTLARYNRPEPEREGLLQFALADYLESLDGYDFVLIDCPPNLYQCSWNALLAADFVVVPLPPEDFGAQGLRAVHQAINNARQLNPRLQLLGHLVTRLDRRLVVHRAYEARIREFYADAVLRTVIPEACAFKVALACRKPVNFYAPDSRAALATKQLSDEILERMDCMTNTQTSGVHGQLT